ncbi:MAG: VanZ family protein [Acidobacteriota bacterium]
MTLRHFARYWLPPLLYVLLITLLSHMTHPPLPSGLEANLLHVPEYALLGLLLARALQAGAQGKAAPPVLASALVLAVLLGGLDEFHQAFVPGRMPDPMDWAHDAAGAFLGVSSWGLWTWLRR